MKKFLRLIESILSLFSFKRLPIFVRTFELTKFDFDFKVSWSQGGEDLALLSILKEIKHGKYIDVGAHHPSRFSVTRHLYQEGWSGINIEANESLISEFDKKRTKDVNIAKFVGSSGKRHFHIFSETALSTSIPEIRDSLVQQSRTLVSSNQVEPISLREIYEKYFPSVGVDLLAIDAEGSDLDVLKSLVFETLEFHRWPKFILLETSPPVSKSLSYESVQYVQGLGYTPQVVLTMATVLSAPKK